MVHQNRFIDDFISSDYQDLQNTLHYYALTHTEIIGYRLVRGVRLIDQQLTEIQCNDCTMSMKTTQLLELIACFESLLMTTYRGLFSYYRSIGYFHGGDVQIDVKEMLRWTDLSLPNNGLIDFDERVLSWEQRDTIRRLIQEQGGLHESLLQSINRLQQVEWLFLKQWEQHPNEVREIDELIDNIRKLLVYDIYEDVYMNLMNVAETIIPTIPMPNKTTTVSSFCDVMIQHSDFVAMMMEQIERSNDGGEYRVCALEKWTDTHYYFIDFIDGMDLFVKKHDAFHLCTLKLTSSDQLEDLYELVMHSSELLTQFIYVATEIAKQK